MSSPAAAPRLEPVTDPSPEQQELLAKTMTRKGRALRVFGVLAHHPRLLRRFNALGGLFMTGTLEARDRELVVLRVAVGTDCGYEFAQHVLIGRAAGLDDDEIRAIGSRDLADWTPEDALLLRMTDELLADDAVSEATYEQLEARFTTEQLLELLLLPGFYRMLAGALNTLRLQPEDDLPSSPALGDVRR